MTRLDLETGYPPGFRPAWWRCPKCGARWHDSEQQGLEVVCWDVVPECGACDVDMVEEILEDD